MSDDSIFAGGRKRETVGCIYRTLGADAVSPARASERARSECCTSRELLMRMVECSLTFSSSTHSTLPRGPRPPPRRRAAGEKWITDRKTIDSRVIYQHCTQIESSPPSNTSCL